MKLGFQFSTLVIVALALVTFSCDANDQRTEADTTPNTIALTGDQDPDGTGDFADDPLLGYEAEIVEHVHEHSVQLDEVEEVVLQRPDGTEEEVYIIEGDIAIDKKQLRDFEEALENEAKQYRTTNLVSPQTVTVIGYTGGTYNLTNKMRTALSWAVNNYNALNINLNFTLSFSSSTNADIVVYRNPFNNGAGGVAGFPSGGQPYKWVQIYNGMENYNTNTVEHVMTHEIGHCLGLRHTDWFSRASCGQNSNEGSAGVGAIHISGTPTGIDWASVMLACFSSNEDGEFGFYDRVALENIY